MYEVLVRHYSICNRIPSGRLVSGYYLFPKLVPSWGHERAPPRHDCNSEIYKKKKQNKQIKKQ